jgi:hypothetical protein
MASYTIQVLKQEHSECEAVTLFTIPERPSVSRITTEGIILQSKFLEWLRNLVFLLSLIMQTDSRLRYIGAWQASQQVDLYSKRYMHMTLFLFVNIAHFLVPCGFYSRNPEHGDLHFKSNTKKFSLFTLPGNESGIKLDTGVYTT